MKSANTVHGPVPSVALEFVLMQDGGRVADRLHEHRRPQAPRPADADHRNAALVAVAMDHYIATGVLLASDGSALDTRGPWR